MRPIPILQIINLLLGLLGLAWEWPLPLFTTAAISTRRSKNSNQKHGLKHTTSNNTRSPSYSQNLTTISRHIQRFLAGMHRSIEARLVVYPLSSLAALLLYQGTNAGLYYIIGMGVYFWGFSEGEVVMGVPWTLPRRVSGSGGRRGASKV